MQQEDFNILSDKIQKEFEFNENSKDFVAFFKPFIIKVLLSIIFSTKISENTKTKVFNIVRESGKILDYFLESLNEKELLILLNNVRLSELLFENLTQKNKEILYTKLNKEIGIFPRILLLNQIPNKLQKIIQEWNINIQNKKEDNEVVRQTYTDDAFQETEKSKTIQTNAAKIIQEEQINIKNLFNDINLSDEVVELLGQTTTQKDQFLIVVSKENINLVQLKKIESLLTTEHDKRALLTNALLNPFIKNNMEILKYIVQQSHDNSDFELWSNAMDELDVLKEKSQETEEDDSFVARLKRSR
ncbi:MAG: hypothetical protein PHY80_00200 [Rickettsiales bacterium]|nr:hypothetical protein [Rickettsiales bacterium]